MPAFLPLLPIQSGYSEEGRATATMYRVEGGRPRGRLDLDEVSSIVSCTWRLRAGPYGQLMSFYRAATEGPDGPQPFETDLLLDGPGLSRYSAMFLPGSMRLERVEGGTYVVSAKLEVELTEEGAADADYDAAVVMLFEEYGSGEAALEILGLLEELVNEELPS